MTTSKSVLITGCSEGGIGHALALTFAARGYRVFASARDPAKMGSLAATQHVECLRLDVTRSDSIDEAKESIKGLTGGTLDVFINNAGLWLESPALDAEIDAIRRVFETNVFGPMEMIRQFTPLLARSKGLIVNISSILGIMPYPITSAYNASKAALSQYSKTLRLELEPLDIRVLTVMTGQVSTNLPQTPTLSEPSVYKPLEPVLVERAKGHIDKSLSVEAYATAVVEQVIRGTSRPRLWKGTNSTVTWLVSTFAPSTGFDFLMKRISGLAGARNEIFKRATTPGLKDDKMP